MHTLVINPGSTSIKYKLFDKNFQEIISGMLENKKGRYIAEISKENESYEWQITKAAFSHPVNLILKETESYDITRIGFRVVHGGEKFIEPVKLDSKVVKEIEEIGILAPLHNPPAVKVIRQFMKELKNIDMYAVFDTSFHSSLKPEQYLYSLPYDLYEKFGIRKYGFHGISHEYVFKELTKLEAKHNKVITLHLGGGASVSAIEDGKCIDTSMGFTPLEGLTMATRSGDVDDGVLFYLAEKHHYTIKDLKQLTNNYSGLLGISGVTSDMRTLLDLEQQGHKRASIAINLYIYDIQRYIGSYIASLNGLDALVFTAGVGAGSDVLRKRICDDISWFGLDVDDRINNHKYNVSTNLKISTQKSIPIWVIPTNEEKMIATTIS